MPIFLASHDMDPDDELEAIEIRLFLEAIHARYGYDLREYATASSRRRVLAVLAKSGFDNLGQLQHATLKDADLFASVLHDLVVRVTKMFRDPSFYRTFRARVVPVLRTYPFLKVWHSGCATGEEAYASAILLSEEGLYARTQIYATDLSPSAVEQAKQGVYSTECLREFGENHLRPGGASPLASYYTEAYGRIALRDSLRKNVLFFQHDLVSDHVFGEMNVIFCRNVLIYFGQSLRERVIAKFAQSLCPGGFLCLGSEEKLPRSGHAFVEFAPEERIYRHEP
jgi:chemotaxis protein methyltransferase CheR